MDIETIAKGLTLEQFESYDLSNFDHDQLKRFIYNSHSSHRDEIIWNLNKWDISKILDMSGMFEDCQSLESLDVSRWDIGSVTDISHMFDGCESLEGQRLPSEDGKTL